MSIRRRLFQAVHTPTDNNGTESLTYAEKKPAMKHTKIDLSLKL